MKKIRLLSCCLLLVGVLAILLPGVALAATDNTTSGTPPTPPDTMTLTANYPKLEGTAGGSFSFDVLLTYIGQQDRNFDLRVTPPAGWDSYVNPQYDTTKKISTIRLTPSYAGGGVTITVVATAPGWPIPDPGQYPITVDVSATNVKGSATLTAVIKNIYSLKTIPSANLYNTVATAGKDNYFSIKVQNFGTGAIDNVNFTTTTVPQGWTIQFKPDKIDSLNAIDEKSIDVDIKPPANAVAGDYNVGIRASGKQATADEMSIRVTVETSTVWGWVGVGIILIVVLGVVVVFMRFSRR